MGILNINDSRHIRDFLRYEELNIKSLTQKIQKILELKYIKISQDKLEESVSEFLFDKEYTDLSEICDFIENLVQ